MKFPERVLNVLPEPLSAAGIEILQVNLGYKCNMSCKHCHIGAGPARSELMNADTVEMVLGALRGHGIRTLDITGGAPELNPHFGRLVSEAGKMGRHVMVRTNLTIFFEDGMEHLPGFYDEHSVELIASFPYYTETEVDRVRGRGAFSKSILAVKRLNALGYGGGLSERKLNLVYNPPGAFPSPSQKSLEEDFKRELKKKYDIYFDNLYTFANMPIGRFREYLVRSGNLDRYMEKLECAFNPETLEGLMCRHILNVDWNGMLYDCDFNQILGLHAGGSPCHIGDFDYAKLSKRTISVADHCYACTAGQGST
jgi:radical SAM/Cys-rich protein